MPGSSPELLDFLQIGETTREDAILKLGQPSGTFEHERILTYRIGEDQHQGRFIVTPKNMAPYWEQVRYSLVLVFGEDGKLRKQTLVPVN